MKKNLIILFCLVLCVFCFSFGVSATPTPWNGTADTSWYNTTDTSFEIDTAEKLAGLAAIVNNSQEAKDANIEQDSFTNKLITLGADLDLGAVLDEDFNNTGRSWTPIGNNDNSFGGVFDGQGHSISHMYCSMTTRLKGQGLFAYAQKAQFSNIYMNNSALNNVKKGNVGILVGYTEDCNFDNCHVDKSKVISINYTIAGGIVGNFNVVTKGLTVTMAHCSANVEIIGKGNCAGLIGQIGNMNNDATKKGNFIIDDCFATGSVTGSTASASFAGFAGICGGIFYEGEVTFQRCYSSMTVESLGTRGAGIVSNACATITFAPDYLTIKSCVALGSKLSYTGTNTVDVAAYGCILANGQMLIDADQLTLADNYTNAEMKLSEGITLSEDAAGINGAATLLNDMQQQTFWMNLGYDLSEKGAWTWSDSVKAPVLKKTVYSCSLDYAVSPIDGNAYKDQAARFSVKAKNNLGDVTYQWQQSADGETWKNIDNALDAVLKVSYSDAEKNGLYVRCLISDSIATGVASVPAQVVLKNKYYTPKIAVNELYDQYTAEGILDMPLDPLIVYACNGFWEGTMDIPYYNKYYGGSLLFGTSDAVAAWDTIAQGLSPRAYALDGAAYIPETVDLISKILAAEEETGTWLPYSSELSVAMFDTGGSTNLSNILALEMCFQGEKWGNDFDGTGGRDLAITAMLQQVKGLGETTYFSKQKNYENAALCAIVCARLFDDPDYGDQAKIAYHYLITSLKADYTNDAVTFNKTKEVSFYLSALVAGKAATKNTVKAKEYGDLADGVYADLQDAKALDGFYCETVKGEGLAFYGNETASQFVLMSLNDYLRGNAILASMTYDVNETENLATDLSAITLPETAENDLILPQKGVYGSVFSWESSAPGVISQTGKVVFPSKATTVTLTVTGKNGEAISKRVFTVAVAADHFSDEDAVSADLNAISLFPEYIHDIDLPVSGSNETTIAWSSSNTDAVTSNGGVIRGSADVNCVLTATVKKGSAEETKEFNILIPQAYDLSTNEGMIKDAYYQSRCYFLSHRNLTSYWAVWEAYAALGSYIQDPANGYTYKANFNNSSQPGAEVLGLVAMGENPYNYQGKNFVTVLREFGSGGSWSVPVFNALAIEGAGIGDMKPAVDSCIGWMKNLSMGPDIGGWGAVIASRHQENPESLAALEYMKSQLSTNIAGNSMGNEALSAGCVVTGFTAFIAAGTEGYDVSKDSPWTEQNVIKMMYDQGFGPANDAVGFNGQIMMEFCDLYNTLYNDGNVGWITCGVTKAKLDNQITKANAILADKEAYEADSIEAIEAALETVDGISADRLNAKIADYGEEYYTLYDAVRYAKAVGQNDIDAAAAAIVTEQINDLPADITLNSKEAVAAARTAYDALTKDQKDLVEANVLKKLTDAEKTIADLEQGVVDEKAAAEVGKTINALPDKVTLKDQSAVEAARAAYDKLTAAQKKLVAEAAVTKLTDAEAQIKAILDKKGVDVENMTDVKEADWFYNDVAYCLENGLFFGTSASTFGSYDAMTRGQFVTILGRNAGISDASGAYPTMTVFDDVDSSVYYASHVKWAVKNGITVGTSKNTFHPNAVITRQDMATMMLRYAKATGIELPAVSAEKFADDGNIADYAKEAVYRLKAAKILTGKDHQLFDPKGTTLRCEVAAVIHRFLTYDPAADLLADDSNAVIVSMEKFTLGQGYVIEPSIVKLQENDTVASVLLRIAEAKGLEMEYDPGSSFYLRSVKDNDTSAAVIPQYILDAAETEDETLGDRATAGWLSEFDYTSQGGWMYWLNNTEIQYSAGDPINAVVKAGDVIRWQFTVVGLGRDLGSTTYGDAYVTVADKDALTHAVAVASKNQKKSAAYSEAITVLQNMEATQAQVDAALGTLTE